MITLTEAITDVTAEYIRASKIFPPFNSAHEGFAIIAEEYDELWEEIKKKNRDPIRMREEATQLAAMAIRFLVDVPEDVSE